MGGAGDDMVRALRALRRKPWFSAAAILVLAVAIGGNAATFGLVNAVLVQPLPFTDPGGLVWIWATRTDRDKAFFSVPDFLDHRAQNSTLADFAGFAFWGANLTGHGPAERVQGLRMTCNAFRVLGTRAHLGRLLEPGDGEGSSSRVAVLTYGAWQRRFGADPALLHQTITLNGENYAVIGILPRDFVFPGAEAELAVPLLPELDPRRAARGTNFMRAFARLKSGVTPAQAAADLGAINERLRQLYPADNAKKTAPRVLPMRDEILGDAPRALLFLQGAVLMVLLLAGVNLANLLLVRATERRGEIALRRALGSTPARLARELAIECGLLGLAGGLVGILLAAWLLPWLVQLSPAQIPRLQLATVDLRVVVFTLLVTLAASAGVGLVPAWKAAHVDPSEVMHGSSRGRLGGGLGRRSRHLLAVTEFALSMILLAAAGLMLKSFLNLQSVKPGFAPERLLTLRLSLPPSRYATREALQGFVDRATLRLTALPGVAGVAAASIVPLSGMNARTDFHIAGRAEATAADMPGAQVRWVSAGYFTTMGIPVLRGREFTESDLATGQSVAIVDAALVRQFWPSGNAVGQTLLIDWSERFQQTLTVAGVVGSVKHMGMRDEPLGTLYLSFAQVPPGNVTFLANGMSLVVRTSVAPRALGDRVRREVQAEEPEAAASAVQTMDSSVSAALAAERFLAQMVGVFAIAAILLAGAGLYAVIAASVAAQTREIGIRMALGSSPEGILRMYLLRGLQSTLAGVAMGAAGVWLAGSLLRGLLFEVGVLDPMVIAVTALALFATAMVATLGPALRARRIDPMAALRLE